MERVQPRLHLQATALAGGQKDQVVLLLPAPPPSDTVPPAPHILSSDEVPEDNAPLTPLTSPRADDSPGGVKRERSPTTGTPSPDSTPPRPSQRSKWDWVKKDNWPKPWLELHNHFRSLRGNDEARRAFWSSMPAGLRCQIRKGAQPKDRPIYRDWDLALEESSTSQASNRTALEPD